MSWPGERMDAAGRWPGHMGAGRATWAAGRADGRLGEAGEVSLIQAVWFWELETQLV